MKSGSTYFVKPEQTTVEAGKVTFAVTNVGELYHEFIVYSNVDGVAAGDLPINEEEDEADLVEENIVGEAPYATPPIVPSDKKPGDADHRIRGGGWGAELTVDLEAGKYILLCNLSGHYTKASSTSPSPRSSGPWYQAPRTPDGHGQPTSNRQARQGSSWRRCSGSVGSSPRSRIARPSTAPARAVPLGRRTQP